MSINPIDATEVIEAMRDIQTEGDRWRLAEALVRLVPEGVEGFDTILDEAKAANVIGAYSRHTLRLYRDSAKIWPADKRVPGVSFTAHREAQALPSIEDSVKMLEDLAKNLGPHKVTVAAVRKAIKVQQGKTTPAQAAAATSKAPVTGKVTQDLLADLMSGAPKLIAAITSDKDLDTLHASLSKVLTHVEDLRAKAAKQPVPKMPVAKKVPAKKAAAPAKPRPDMRGL